LVPLIRGALLMRSFQTSFGRFLDQFTRAATRSAHRLTSTVPVLDRWPGTGIVRQAIYRRTLAPTHERLLNWAATRHRRRLSGMIVVGITGSAGKTTTKDLVASVLATCFAVHKTIGSANHPMNVARVMLSTRRTTEVCVIELSGHKPGALDRPLDTVRPNHAVVTNVGSDHFSAFSSLDAIAAEKAKVVGAIPADGTAVLNADDPRVIAMRDRCAGHVITYGRSTDAMLRAQGVTADWPDTLAFTATWRGEAVRVRTQLLGAHWCSAVLAALAAGLALGVPLSAAAEAVATVPPFDGRMSPHAVKGITFIRDDWKASHSTIPAAFDFMRDARAGRKVIVVGSISDKGGNSGVAYRRVAAAALDIADHVIFVGPKSSKALRAGHAQEDGRLRAFAAIKTASDYLETILRPGDLVLVKGSQKADHLVRLILAHVGDVACWRAECAKDIFCDTCSLLRVASHDGEESAGGSLSEFEPGLRLDELEGTRRQAVVGLGNSEERYRGTPHNVGYVVLDRLAARLGIEWSPNEEGVVGRVEGNDRILYLLKLWSPINLTGPALARAAERLRIDPGKCVLVHDDLDLPLGTVRARLRGGSDGGHRGVRSVLESFQTDRCPRIKVGVRPESPPPSARDYLLTPFSSSSAVVIDQACGTAAKRAMDLLRQMGFDLTAPSRW